MPFDDRLGWFAFGMVVGLVLGYIVRSLRDIKEELDEVDEILKEERDTRKRDESGLVRYPILLDIALFLVIVMTVWAAFASQRASNDVKDTQDSVQTTSDCTYTLLSKTLSALNERTTYTIDQAEANIQLQKDQAKFFALLLHKPPYSEARRTKAAEDYFKSLQTFNEFGSKTLTKVKSNPLPTEGELRSCLRQTEGEQ